MKFDTAKALKLLSGAVVIAVGISSIASAWVLYKNHIWRPKVDVDHVDFSNGIAELIVGGRKKTLYGNSVVWAGGDWGVRFGMGAGNKYDRIEVVKGNFVHQTLLIS